MECSGERRSGSLCLVPAGLRRCMSCNALSAGGCLLLCVLATLSLLLLPCTAKNITVECNLFGDEPKCPPHDCCVKKVITFQSSELALVGTECQPLLTEGAMCLRNSEGYMCPCLPQLLCHLASPYDTMGYCKPRR